MINYLIGAAINGFKKEAVRKKGESGFLEMVKSILKKDGNRLSHVAKFEEVNLYFRKVLGI